MVHIFPRSIKTSFEILYRMLQWCKNKLYFWSVLTIALLKNDGEELPQSDLFSKNSECFPVPTCSLSIHRCHLTIYLEQGWSNYYLLAIASLLIISINKILLEHSAAHLFTYCQWRLSRYNGRTEQLWDSRWPTSQNIYILVLFRKILRLCSGIVPIASIKLN